MESGEAIDFVQRVVPNGYVELTFHFADRLRKRKQTEEMQPGIMLCGQQTGYFDVLPTRKTSMLSIQFFPHSAGLFFDIPIHELANETLDLRDVIGPIGSNLEEELHDIQSLKSRIAHIEHFLLKCISKKTNYEWNRIFDNIRIINSTKGIISPHQLAEAACLSRKQHERIFKRLVGLPPKQFLNIIRFQYALFVHQQYPNESLTELAYRCGYYDQSHMINHFRELSGITPGQYFTDCETPYSDYFM